MSDPNAPTLGGPVARFVYDGLGRLIRQVTHLDADVAVETDLYYDGVRRISERSQETEQVEPLQGLFEIMVQDLSDPISVDVWDELEYVWDGSGISASGGYVDEIAFVLTDDGSVRYALLDGNYNLMGWMRPNGNVMFQYVYGPYGDLRAADKLPTLSSFPPMPIGHQGLFFVRFDGDPGDPPLTVGAQGLYYNRNRWYSPELGRFTTCDVKATGLPLIEWMSFNGKKLIVPKGGYDCSSHYSDGLNVYEYVRACPIRQNDPSGLFCFGDLGGSAGIAGRMYSTYDTADTILGMVRAFANGVSVSNIMFGVALELATDKLGGKAFDSLLDFTHGIRNTLAKRFSKGWNSRVFDSSNYRQAYEDLYGALPANYHVHHKFPQEFEDW